MKKRSRIVPILLVVLVAAGFVSTLVFLYQRSRPKAAVLETERPFITDIVKKTVAAGTIVPREEVEIKPLVAGLLEKIHVKPGQTVRKGDTIADVQIVPDLLRLNEAELRLKSSRLRLQRAEQDLERVRALDKQGVAPRKELELAEAEHEAAKQELDAAQDQVQLIRVGAAKQAKTTLTRVEATVAGTVLAIPVREGSSVINANSFNPGTTIATVADLRDMIFEGRVDESEVDHLREGMPVEIVVGAIENQTFAGQLEYISPKSLEREGVTEFEIEAAFRAPPGVTVRAGYSANANIVLDRRDKVLAVNEAVLSFEGERASVEVQTAPGVFQKRPVELGLSNGIKIEVKAGIRESDVLKRPTPKKP